MRPSTIIIGGGMVGGAVARQLAERGEEAAIVKNVRPGDVLAIPQGTRRVIVTAQSRDAHVAVATEDLVFVNTGLVEKALAASHAAGVEEFCLFSTGSVYRAQSRPLREGDPVDEAPGPYAATKLAAERAAQSWASRFRRMLILRPFTIYGPGLAASRLLARLPDMARQGREITLASGEGLITNPIHAEDAARCALHLLNAAGLALFNLGGAQTVSLREIVEIMAGELGLRPRFAKTAEPPRILVGDIAALRAAGAEPIVEAHAGLRDYYRSFAEVTQ